MDRRGTRLVRRFVHPLYDRAGGLRKNMTLLQLTEPLFQHVCRLNRLARRGGPAKSGSGDTTYLSLKPEAAGAAASAAAKSASLDYTVPRAEIKALFEDLMAKASAD